MSEYLRTNFALRRVLALLFALVSFGVCVAVVIGKIDLSLWQAIAVLFVGLLFYEWAG